ncbi:MAG TPA: GspH/FimT family protein [Caldimonas sp.]|nr:GspH/FimT family protein [Caldimonas sp.]
MDTKHRATPAALRSRGLSLIELAITLAVVAIVAASAAPSLASLIDARRLDAAANELAADVQWVRTEAVARNRPVRLSFHSSADASCWIVHTGAAAQCRCGSDATPVCAGDAIGIKSVLLVGAERVAVAANVASIVFDPLHGTATPTGTLRLIDVHGRAVHHVVNIMGRVRSCTPSSLAGWRAC